MSSPIHRTALELYRDCLRLVKHVAPGYSPKARALRQTVRSQFEANRGETDAGKIQAYKANAVRALSNYMLYQSAQKDTQLQHAMKEQVANATKDQKKPKP
eukprot:Nitzschia sp. Nitz4//scaffold5_size260463//231421//231858//NITZ4_001024-RA/size260463-augustus-gene-0.42-mRNA-1//-1//CDS//3329555466//6735//frame0